MMLSVLVPMRNTPQIAAQCLSAMLMTFREARLRSEAMIQQGWFNPI